MSAKRLEPPPTHANGIITELLGVMVLLSLATGVAMQHRTRLELREERQTLLQLVDRVTTLLADNEPQKGLGLAANPDQPSAGVAAAELLRLRVEVGALVQLTNVWSLASNENAVAHAELNRYILDSAPKIATADFWPRNSWSSVGYTSPDDALRSSLWASKNGNLPALLDGMTGQLFQMVKQQFEGKSADEAAIQAMDEIMNLKSVQVLSREYPSADTAVLTAAFEDGPQIHTNRLLLQRVDNRWKLAGQGGD